MSNDAPIIEGKGEQYQPPSFHWTLNAGRIVEGQDSREIEARSSRLRACLPYDWKLHHEDHLVT
jgi:hypothetical protein